MFTDSTYTCYPLLAATDGKEKYDWSVSGGSNDNWTYYMQWNTPLDEGNYTVTLNVTKDDGSLGKFIKKVFVELSSTMGEPIQAPTIVDARITDLSGNNDGHYYTDTVYKIIPLVDGTNELIDNFAYSYSAGVKLSIISGILEWKSPDVPGDVTIHIEIRDVSGNIMDTKEIVIPIEL